MAELRLSQLDRILANNIAAVDATVTTAIKNTDAMLDNRLIQVDTIFSHQLKT